MQPVRSIVILLTIGSVLVGCAYQRLDVGNTASELPASDEDLSLTRPGPLKEDYSSVYKSDAAYVDVVKLMLDTVGTPASASSVALNILGYEELRLESEIGAARARAIYTYKSATIPDCPQEKPFLLRSTRRVGAEYLSELFFGHPSRQSVDGVVAGLLGDWPPEPFHAPPRHEQIERTFFVAPEQTSMFCQPLDLTRIVPSLAELKDTHPYLYGSPFAFLNEAIEAAKWSAWAKGQYIPTPVWTALREELDLLIDASPLRILSLKHTRLVVDYQADEFFLEVAADGSSIRVPAVLIRHAVLQVATEDTLRLLEIDRDVAERRMDEASMTAEARRLAQQAKARLREIFSLALAHELAHVYLGTGQRLELNEERVDCHAITNVSRTRAVVPLGLVGWLDSDASGKAGRFWSVEEQSHLAAVQRRVQTIRRLAELPGEIRRNPAQLCAAG